MIFFIPGSLFHFLSERIVFIFFLKFVNVILATRILLRFSSLLSFERLLNSPIVLIVIGETVLHSSSKDNIFYATHTHIATLCYRILSSDLCALWYNCYFTDAFCFGEVDEVKLKLRTLKMVVLNSRDEKHHDA